MTCHVLSVCHIHPEGFLPETPSKVHWNLPPPYEKVWPFQQALAKNKCSLQNLTSWVNNLSNKHNTSRFFVKYPQTGFSGALRPPLSHTLHRDYLPLITLGNTMQQRLLVWSTTTPRLHRLQASLARNRLQSHGFRECISVLLINWLAVKRKLLHLAGRPPGPPRTLIRQAGEGLQTFMVIHPAKRL